MYIAEENSESYREEIVLEPAAVENLSQTTKAKGDSAEPFESTSSGVESTPSVENERVKEKEGFNEQKTEDEDTIRSAQEPVSVNASQQDVTGEGQNERGGVLGDVRARGGQNQEKSEESHEEL